MNGVWQEEAKLVPTDGASGDRFGYDVALSGDTAIIGSPDDDDKGDNSGSGYVYTKIDGKWIENVKIVPENGATYDLFGYSVAISGSTALFGASNGGEENGGSVYIVDDLCVP